VLRSMELFGTEVAPLLRTELARPAAGAEPPRDVVNARSWSSAATRKQLERPLGR
jgi:hypothetical protein